MKVKVSEIRPAYARAKQEFSRTWRSNGRYRDHPNFFVDFGEANNMKITIDRYEAGFPVITVIEFNDEKAYAWFMLRWA